MTQNIARISEFYVIKMHVSASGCAFELRWKFMAYLLQLMAPFNSYITPLSSFPAIKFFDLQQFAINLWLTRSKFFDKAGNSALHPTLWPLPL